MDMTKINAVLTQLEQTAVIAIKVAALLVAVLALVDILVGTNLGVMQRLSTLLDLAPKAVVGWVIGAWVFLRVVGIAK